MHVLITGGTGFIGRHLVAALASKAQLTVLTRQPDAAQAILGEHVTCTTELATTEQLESVDAIINLAGEPIADKRWTRRQKQVICDSRWLLTEKLADAIERCSNPPALISGSAIGFYGNQGDNWVDEQSDINQLALQNDFAHQVCQEWEQQALRIASITRVCIVRTGVVLAPQFGALKKMLPPYRLGLGGPFGSGSQYMSWIHIDDMVRLLMFLLDSPSASGVFNATAPNPTTNAEFSQRLAATLRRPHILKTPAFALKLALGEMANLLLDGQRVRPSRLLEAGFKFHHPELAPALDDLLNHH